MARNAVLSCSLAIALGFAVSPDRAEDQTGPVTIRDAQGKLEVAVAGKPFFVYQYDTANPELRRPVIHPLYAPSGAVITQMGEIPDKRTAHFHHTGLWLAHQNFTQGNNWQMDADPKASPRKFSGQIHRKFEDVKSGKEGRIVERLEWDNVKGDTILLEETRVLMIPDRPLDSRVIDFDITLKARGQPITLMKTPYQFLALRVVNAMLAGPKTEGPFLNSKGDKNPKNGALAEWISVTGPLQGATVGVALFNHPGNFRHPTPCLNFSGQTIGLSPTFSEDRTIAANESLRLRYRVLVYAGTPNEAKVAEEYAAYTRESK